ncbi:hypothetical protein TWF694_003552 [Orbilia ellipsospora]|uniref:Uncharacterized protein n=1 Tax=Orbilia ellipsospora TaxID=2528407 RepID=A0AAV9X4H4_9PEZI
MMNLLSIFAVVAAILPIAQAQIILNTPQGAKNGVSFPVSWTGGTPPYILELELAGNTNIVQSFTGINASPFNWVPNVIDTAVSYFFLIRDANGILAQSAPFFVAPGGNTLQTSTTQTCTASTVTVTSATTVMKYSTITKLVPIPTTIVVTSVKHATTTVTITSVRRATTTRRKDIYVWY